MSLAKSRIGVAQRRHTKGRNTTIEDAGYRGVPYPEIRCPDRHLADAEVVSLGLKLVAARYLSHIVSGSTIGVHDTLFGLSVFCFWTVLRQGFHR